MNRKMKYWFRRDDFNHWAFQFLGSFTAIPNGLIEHETDFVGGFEIRKCGRLNAAFLK